MPVVFHGNTNTAEVAANATMTMTMPASTPVGAILFAQINQRGTGAVTADAGWNVIRSLTDGNNTQNNTQQTGSQGRSSVFLAWRIHTGTNPPLTFTGMNGPSSGGLIAYKGQDVDAPIVQQVNVSGTGVSGFMNIASTNNRLVNFIFTNPIVTTTPLDIDGYETSDWTERSTFAGGAYGPRHTRKVFEYKSYTGEMYRRFTFNPTQYAGSAGAGTHQVYLELREQQAAGATGNFFAFF